MIRKLELLNEYGDTYDLNNVKTGFLHEPTGFGYAMEYQYMKIGPYWHEMYLREAQQIITGTMLFDCESPYEANKEFLRFVRVSKRLQLRRTTDAGTYLKDVVIVSYEISELTTGKTLQCPIQLLCTSLWYSEESTRAQFVTSGDGLRYSYRLDARFNDFGNGYVEIDNDGSIGADFQVEFEGAIANPVIYIEVGGKETARVEITGTASSGETILYQSKDGEGEHYCYFGDAEDIADFKNTGNTENLENLVSGFDITNANFFKIPVGTSRMYITADSALTNPITINIYKYYRAV